MLTLPDLLTQPFSMIFLAALMPGGPVGSAEGHPFIGATLGGLEGFLASSVAIAFQSGDRGRLPRHVVDSLATEAPMSAITLEVDLPPGVTIAAYQRHADGHEFEV